MYNFTKVDFDSINIDEFLNFPSKSVLTSIGWINFIKEDQNAVPVVIRIESDGRFVGYFTALSVFKYGIKIIGSPFQGWSTVYMGLDLFDKNEKINIYTQLVPYLFKSEKCQFIQINDRDVSIEMAEKAGFRHSKIRTLELPVNVNDEGLFKKMKVDCRNYIRQFEKRGATIEQAIPDDVFAGEYYEQLKDVFAKQKLVPNYSLRKVKVLIKNLHEHNSVLCLRVRDPEGKSIATSIFPGGSGKFFFWGGASYRHSQHYRPNEYMIYRAIQYWRDRGCEVFDMVGVREYKKKFGPTEVEYASLIFAQNNFLFNLKNLAEKMFYFGIKVKGFISKKG